MMTHQAPEGAAQKAVQDIGKLAAVRGNAVKMRVLD
jgi:hypothetical protein